VGVPTCGNVDQVNYIGHLQLEQNTFPTSRIVTTATAETRATARLLISNDENERALWGPFGGFKCKVRPEWDASDVASDNKTIYWCQHDADNHEWLYYDGANTRWVLERKVATNTYRATYTHSPVAGTSYAIGARWTGSAGELGLTAFTASVFVDGAKGTDVVTSAAPTEAADVDLERGSAGSDTYTLDSQIWDIIFYQYVPTDEEMAR
jgi:hypothetical protein